MYLTMMTKYYLTKGFVSVKQIREVNFHITDFRFHVKMFNSHECVSIDDLLGTGENPSRRDVSCKLLRKF